MSRINIPAAVIEFDVNGNTIWVHNEQGMTVLRIKTMGKINISKECINPCSHSDMIVDGDINICLAESDVPKE